MIEATVLVVFQSPTLVSVNNAFAERKNSILLPNKTPTNQLRSTILQQYQHNLIKKQLNIMSMVSLFSNAAGSNSTTNATMTELITHDDWKALAQHFLCDQDGTSTVDTFCNTLIQDASSQQIGLWNHAITKTVGWVVVLLLKTIFLEQPFDRWSGTYRFLNIGSTLAPFGMAMWTILEAFDEVSGNDEPLSKFDILLTLGKNIAATSRVTNFIFTALAWRIVHRIAFRTMHSSKVYSTIELIPGIMSTILSMACWIIGETTVATMLLGFEGEPSSNALLLYSKLIQYASNAITGWYCYAWMVNAMFGKNRCTSFSWFLFVVVAGKFALSGSILL